MTPEHLEGLRRSHVSAGLPRSQVDELLETAIDLARRQREIDRILHSLTTRWPGVRAALNELAKLTKGGGVGSR